MKKLHELGKRGSIYFDHFFFSEVPTNFAGSRLETIKKKNKKRKETLKLSTTTSDILLLWWLLCQVPPSHSTPLSRSLSRAWAICSVCPNVRMSTQEKPSGSNHLFPLRLQHVVCPLHISLSLPTNPLSVCLCERDKDRERESPLLLSYIIHVNSVPLFEHDA